MRSPVQYIAILWLLLLPVMGEIGFPFLPSLLIVMFLVIVTISYPYIVLIHKKRKFEKEEWEENLREGGIEEPHTFRNLSPEEEQSLHDLYRTSKMIMDNGILLILVFGLFDILGMFWILNSSREALNDIIFPVYTIGFLIQIALAGVAAKEMPRYLDLRSPVFKVQGQVIKEKIKNRRSTDYYVTIRRIKFSEEDYPSLSQFFYEIQDGDEIAVEYSPRTKHVWKMYKTEDIK